MRNGRMRTTGAFAETSLSVVVFASACYPASCESNSREHLPLVSFLCAFVCPLLVHVPRPNTEYFQAELALEQYFEHNAELVVFGLVASLRHAEHYPVRMLAAVILRRRLPRGETDLMSQLPEDLQETVKEEVHDVGCCEQ